MTICIASLCEDAKTIVLVADRMLGLGFIEAEPEISKTFQLHNKWRVMLAGNNISPAFDIIDEAKKDLEDNESPDVQAVIHAIASNYEKSRLSTAVGKYLTPRGWTIDQFRTEGRQLIGDMLHRQLDSAIADYKLSVQFLVAGFDDHDCGKIFSVDNPGIASRHDIPGFHVIGSGNVGASYMMFYREFGPKLSLPEALYYTFEAKYFAELASGVGTDTDAYILRMHDKEVETTVSNKTIKLLFKVCEAVEPAKLPDEFIEGIKDLPEISGKSKTQKKLEAALKKPPIIRPKLIKPSSAQKSKPQK